MYLPVSACGWIVWTVWTGAWLILSANTASSNFSVSVCSNVALWCSWSSIMSSRTPRLLDGMVATENNQQRRKRFYHQIVVNGVLTSIKNQKSNLIQRLQNRRKTNILKLFWSLFWILSKINSVNQFMSLMFLWIQKKTLMIFTGAATRRVIYKICSLKFRKIHKRTPVQESFFLKGLWLRYFPVNF